MRRDNLSIIVLSVCMAAIVLSAVFIGYSFGTVNASANMPAVGVATFQTECSSAPAPASVPESQQPIQNESIAIPGFEKLTIEGNTIHAEGINNPEQNACYFIVSLMLANETELYRSTILAPGQSIGTVELANPPVAGVYEGAIARYSCYALKTMQPLNGADISFTLEVLP